MSSSIKEICRWPTRLCLPKDAKPQKYASQTKQRCLDYIRGPEMPHNKGYIFCTTLRDPINVTCVVKAEEVMHPLPNEGFHFNPQPFDLYRTS